MRVVVIDFETFWRSKDYSLSHIGPITYIRDEKFVPQLVGISINGQPAQVYSQPTVETLKSLIDFDDDIIVGHNIAGFDALILSEYFGLHPRHVWDTMYAMRWTGLSSISSETHKALTALLGHGEKKDGTVVSDGKQWPHDFTAEEQAFFMRYCADDTVQCAENLRAMLPYLANDALKFMSITARMATEPVFELDEALLAEFIRQLDEEAEEARRRIMEVFHFASLQDFFKAIRSAAKFASMLQELGVEPPVKLSEAKTKTAGVPTYTYAFAKSDIEFLALREHSDPRVRLLVDTRLEMNSSILRSRAETLLKFAKHKKPIPIMLSAFKARTGRYSAGASEGKTDALQFQNLSKRNPAHLPLRRAIKAPRGMKVVAVDSSQVEARVLAYEANHCELLEHFRQGRDPYAELAVNFVAGQATAQEIHDGAKSGDKHCKQLRNVAKTLILACIARGTPVLTNRGWVPLECVALHDMLWDGQDWRPHGGVVFRGYKEVVNRDGIFMTPDHLIWSGNVWVPAEYYGADYTLDDALAAGKKALLTDCPSCELQLPQYTWKAPVYDIMNCGPNNRFLIKTDSGALLVHNCGYGTSAQKFSDTLIRQGLKLADTPERHNEIAKNYHVIYRANNYPIVQFWRTCQSILDALVVGGSGQFGGPDANLFTYGVIPICGRQDLAVSSIGLPNGYYLRYPNLRMQENSDSKIEYVYDVQKGKSVIPTRIFGAKLAENLTQSLAFAILIWQACRMDEAGISLKGNNHDCWYTVVPEEQAQGAFEKMMWHMKQVPAWAAGCPIDCDGELGNDFTIC